MALTDYTGLQSAVADFLNRDDLALSIPTFIALAEAQMQRDIRHWRMHERAAASISDRYIALPGDWVETIRLTIGGHPDLRLVSTAAMEALRGFDDTGGRPQYYAHTAGEIEVWPTPDQAYDGEMVYVQKIPALSDSAPTNWVIDQAPDVYLYGALVATAPFLQEDARVQVWGGLYTAGVAKLNSAGEAALWSGRGLVMRSPR